MLRAHNKGLHYPGVNTPKKDRLLNMQAWLGTTNIDTDLAPASLNFTSHKKYTRHNVQMQQGIRLTTSWKNEGGKDQFFIKVRWLIYPGDFKLENPAAEYLNMETT